MDGFLLTADPTIIISHINNGICKGRTLRSAGWFLTQSLGVIYVW